MKEYILKIVIIAAIIILASPEMAMAYSLKDSTGAIIGSIEHMPIIISAIAYIHGGATVLAGANKLKAHAEDPGKTPMAQGVSRIALGSVIASMPTFMGWIQSSLNVYGGGLHFNPMSFIR